MVGRFRGPAPLARAATQNDAARPGTPVASRARVRVPLLWSVVLGYVAGCASPDAGDTGHASAADDLIGGKPATAKAFDAVGVLLAAGRPFCTATLIAPQAAITASHCVTGQWCL